MNKLHSDGELTGELSLQLLTNFAKKLAPAVKQVEQFGLKMAGHANASGEFFGYDLTQDPTTQRNRQLAYSKKDVIQDFIRQREGLKVNKSMGSLSAGTLYNREVVDALYAGYPETAAAKVKTQSSSIKQSVLRGHPIFVNGSINLPTREAYEAAKKKPPTQKELREEFMTWYKSEVSEESYNELKDLVTTYEEAAIKAKLMERKDRTRME
jgi:hypothetical protein